MGSGVSRNSDQLVCPSGYSEEKFKKIIKAFDRLDRDGDQAIESEEAATMANLHVKNKIRLLSTHIDERKRGYDLELSRLNNQSKIELEKLELKWKNHIENYKNGFGEQQELLNKKLAFYQGLNKEGAKKEVIKAIVGKDDKIEFWKFYDYMKDKTDDLDNLEY